VNPQKMYRINSTSINSDLFLPSSQCSTTVAPALPGYCFGGRDRLHSNSDDREDKTMVIYPNPGNEFISILTDNSDDLVNIYNVYGEKIYSNRFSGESKIDISKLAPGMYIIYKGKTSKKFIKQ
jgi:hypothetical protein